MSVFSSLDRWALLAGVLCYVAAAAGTIWAMLRSRRSVTGRLYAVVAAGFALQTFGLYLRGQTVGGCPIGNNFEVIQFVAWSLMLLYLVVGPAFQVSILGVASAVLGALLGALAFTVPAWDLPRAADAVRLSPWIEFHAALALFSYGVFALLAVTAQAQLVQHANLKRKRLNLTFSLLPPLVQLEEIGLRLLVTGFALLTISLLVGSVFWLRHLDSVDVLKLGVTTAVWLAFGTVLALRLARRLVSESLAWTCLLLFLAVLLSLWPVNARRSDRAAVAPAAVRPL